MRKRMLLARYVQAFEVYDIDGLVSLITEDATQSMPSYDLWVRRREDRMSAADDSVASQSTAATGGG